MILVTGATGNVGKEVVTLLSRKGERVKALSRNTKTPFSEWGEQVEMVEGDFDQADSIREVMNGVEKVVLISPADESMIKHQETVITEAKKAGVKKIVKLSGLGAGPDAPVKLAQYHYEIENKIIESGIPHTFVRPNLFMQVLLGSLDSIKSDQKIYAPAGDGKISFVDTRDVATVIVEALAEEKSSIYEMTGPEAISYEQAAKKISAVFGKEIEYIDVSPEEARSSMIDSGMNSWLADAFLELFAIYRDGMGSGVLTDSVVELKKSQARDFKSFIEERFSRG